MQAKTMTLSAVLCGLTALSAMGCEAHVLTTRLPGTSSASPPSAAPPTSGAPDTDASRATTMNATSPPGRGPSWQPPAAKHHAAYTPEGCDEPGGCYYGVRLVGYPVEEAKRRAIEFGYQGQIDVLEGHSSACKAGTVCEVEPANWPAFGTTMTLYVNYVNRELKISKPE